MTLDLTTGAARPGENIREVLCDLIDIPDGRRVLDPHWVGTLAAEFRQRGQRTPGQVIESGERYRLVFGAHRLAARKLNGDRTFTAVVVPASVFASEAEIWLATIGENLLRRELSALDRAFDVAAWRDIFEAIKGPVKRGGDRRSEDFKVSRLRLDTELEELGARFADSFTQAAQIALGLSRPAVFRHLQVAQLGEDMRQRIALHAVADKQTELLALVRQPRARWGLIVDRLLDGATCVADAIAIIEDTPPAQRMTRWEKVSETFSRLPATEQHNFFALHEDAVLQWVASRKA